jgi:ABC-type transport system substrate-binding protein
MESYFLCIQKTSFRLQKLSVFFVFAILYLVAQKVMAQDSAVTVNTSNIGIDHTLLYSPVTSKFTFHNAVLGRLVTVNDAYQIEPSLLKTWRWDYKNNAYILELRHDLVFHNGRKVSSKDLEFGIARHFLSTKSGYDKIGLKNIVGSTVHQDSKKYFSGIVKGISILDDYTISISLTAPNPVFFYALSHPSMSPVPIEEIESDYVTWKNLPVGCGAFKVTSKTSSGYLLQSTHSKSVIISLVSGNTPADIYLWNPYQNKLAESILNRDSKTIILVFNYNSKLSANLNFRKFLNSIVNREAMAQTLPTHYEPSFDIIPKYFWGSKKETSSNNTEVTFNNFSNIQINLDISRLNVKEAKSTYLKPFTELLKSKNIEINLMEEMGSELKADIEIIELATSVFYDPLIAYGFFVSGSPFIDNYEKNELFEKNFRDALNSATLDDRVKKVLELSRIFDENVIAIPLLIRKNSIFYDKSKIKEINPTNDPVIFDLNRIELLNNS